MRLDFHNNKLTGPIPSHIGRLKPYNPSQFLSFSSISSHFLPSLLQISPPPPLQEISCIQPIPSRRITHHRHPSCPARTLSSSNSPSTSVVLATTIEHKLRVKVFGVLFEVSITLFLVAYDGRIVSKKSNTFRVKCGMWLWTWNSCEVKGFEGQIGMEISSIQSKLSRKFFLQASLQFQNLHGTTR
uniref:Uncharacterized protein n=1 Tax=Cucumis melo TaxID=3656 RepID=A0A9I9E856_CUCME